MPKIEMKDLCCSPKHSTTDTTVSSPSRFGLFSPPRSSFSDSVIDRTLEISEPMILKWDPNATTAAKVTSLFYENRKEANDFIKCVYNLQKAMHFHSTENAKSEKLLRAQSLMKVAMKRLQKEFYQILSINRVHLDPESISTLSSRTSTATSPEFEEEDDDNDCAIITSDSILENVPNVAMTDLRTIADCMTAAGYANECLKIYKVTRKSIIDESIYRLGVEKFSASQVRKMDWEVMDMKIKDWLNAMNVAMKTLFDGERTLCDHVFGSNDPIRESCFAQISHHGAMTLFTFPENVAKNSKKSPEKVFRLLDMYSAIAEHWPDIETIFESDSESVIRCQAVTSLEKLAESVRAGFAEFETALQKESSKLTVAGGGIHHLTIDVMSYISLLADYSNVLSNILAEAPPPASESLFDVTDSDESPAPAISLKFARFILVLLSKLDGKADRYKDVALAYLFLANNLQYVVVKVSSSNLKYLLGENWLVKHEEKITRFASKYERLGWYRVIESLPQELNVTMAPQQVKEIFKKFNSSFEEAYRKHSAYIVPDSKLREDLKASIARKIIPLYREFYNAHKLTVAREKHSSHVIRFSPDDIGHQLNDLFFEPMIESSESTSSFEFSPSHTTL